MSSYPTQYHLPQTQNDYDHSQGQQQPHQQQVDHLQTSTYVLSFIASHVKRKEEEYNVVNSFNDKTIK